MEIPLRYLNKKWHRNADLGDRRDFFATVLTPTELLSTTTASTMTLPSAQLPSSMLRPCETGRSLRKLGSISIVADPILAQVQIAQQSDWIANLR